jgi:hypothetical protein
VPDSFKQVDRNELMKVNLNTKRVYIPANFFESDLLPSPHKKLGKVKGYDARNTPRTTPCTIRCPKPLDAPHPG